MPDNVMTHLYRSSQPLYEGVALAWMEDGDRHAYEYDPHSYRAAGVTPKQDNDMASEFLWDFAFLATVLFSVLAIIYTIADWWGSR